MITTARRLFVASMYLVHGHWDGAKAWEDASSEDVIREIEDLFAAGIISDELRPYFLDCLHGERLAQVNAKSEQRAA